MFKNLQKGLCFERILELISNTPFRVYNIFIAILILTCLCCNYVSDCKFPMIWIPIVGFIAIIYFILYSIKQTNYWMNGAGGLITDDTLLSIYRQSKERMCSNWNWLLITIIPAFILPVVIYIIKYPLGLPIKLFCYTALYIIMALSFIEYTQYINLIKLTHDCSKSVNQISDCEEQNTMSWVIQLSSLVKRQSILFMVVGTGFITLLYLVTLTDYTIPMSGISGMMGILYLWVVVALAIIVMFPILVLYSHFSIKRVILKLQSEQG